MPIPGTCKVGDLYADVADMTHAMWICSSTNSWVEAGSRVGGTKSMTAVQTFIVHFNDAQLGSIINAIYYLGTAIMIAAIIRGMLNR